MSYEWSPNPANNPNPLITFYCTRSGPPWEPVSFDVSITIDGGGREDTALALGDIKDALESKGFEVQTISTGSYLQYTLEETA